MKRQARFNTRQRLWAISLFLMLVLVGLQLFMQRFFVEEMRGQYMVNMDITIDRLVGDIRETLENQERACTYIVDEPDISEYASTADAQERYLKAFSNVRPIVRIATQYSLIDHVVIYDISNSWFQYIGALEHSNCRQLRDGYVSRGADTVSSAVVLGGKLYFCSVAPIHRVQNREVARVGFVAVLTGIDTLRSKVAQLDALTGSTLLLHDSRSVLLSDKPHLEGVDIASAPLGDAQYYVKSQQILSNLTISISIPHSQMFPQQATLALAFILVALCFVMALMITLSLSTRWFSRPIEQVVNQVDALSQPGGRIMQTGVTHIDGLVQGVNALMERLEEANRQYNETQQTLFEAERFHHITELHLLKKQINAHFLYNCLTGIQMLVKQGDSKRAGNMAQEVALLMRYTHDAREEVNVFDEMRIIQRYVDIMNIRFDNRFEYTFEIDDRLCDYKMLKLLLQPLAENALVHGLEKKPGMGQLHITGFQEGNSLCFLVKDTGVGMDAQTLCAIERQLADRDDNYRFMALKGISLINIQRRIRAAYGEGYGITIESKKDEFTCVMLMIPAVADDGLNATEVERCDTSADH